MKNCEQGPKCPCRHAEACDGGGCAKVIELSNHILVRPAGLNGRKDRKRSNRRLVEETSSRVFTPYLLRKALWIMFPGRGYFADISQNNGRQTHRACLIDLYIWHQRRQYSCTLTDVNLQSLLDVKHMFIRKLLTR